VAGKVYGAFHFKLGTLQDRLGDLHDLAVAAYDKTMIPDDPTLLSMPR
jgi:CHAD domain-containing protein